MNNFKQLNLDPKLLSALNKQKFLEPTGIQSQVLPSALEGRDIVASASTGSGKTLAFLIPAMNNMAQNPNYRAIVLAPTREIAEQISKVAATINGELKLDVTLLIGGASMMAQLRSLKRQPQLVIATPGRTIDHIQRRSLVLSKFSMLVLDEGDRLLDMGFAPQLQKVQDQMPANKQSMLFSATMPKSVLKVIEKNLTNPKMIGVEENAGLPKIPTQIKQSVLNTDTASKNSVLLGEIEKRGGSMIIFTRTKRRTDQLARFLGKQGLKVGLIHGDRSQRQRSQAMDQFKNGKTSILVATDVAARGIDVPNVGHVVNYDLPPSPEDFVHRIGRTGRAGAEGESLSLVIREERAIWDSISLYLEKGIVQKVKGPSRARNGGGHSSGFKGGGARGGRSGGRGGARGGASSKRPGFSADRSEGSDASERSERSESSGSHKMGGMQRARSRNKRKKENANKQFTSRV